MPVNTYNVVLENVTNDKMNWDFANILDFDRDDSDAQTIIPWQTMERIIVPPTHNNGLVNTHVINLFSASDLSKWDTKAVAIAIAQRTEKILDAGVIKESADEVRVLFPQ